MMSSAPPPAPEAAIVLVHQQTIQTLQQQLLDARSLSEKLYQQAVEQMRLLDKERRLHQQTSDELTKAKQRMQQLDDDDASLQTMVNTEAKENEKLRQYIKGMEDLNFSLRIDNQDLRTRLQYLQKTVVDPVLKAAHDAQQIQPMKE
jgi:hypothetical protein